VVNIVLILIVTSYSIQLPSPTAVYVSSLSIFRCYCPVFPIHACSDVMLILSTILILYVRYLINYLAFEVNTL
jgi:hypothetical protein